MRLDGLVSDEADYPFLNEKGEAVSQYPSSYNYGNDRQRIVENPVFYSIAESATRGRIPKLTHARVLAGLEA